MKISYAKHGVVVEFDGAFWGTIYSDGKCTQYGWGILKDAKIGDGNYCTTPTDMTYKGSPDEEELKKGTLRKVTITTEFDVSD